MRKSRALGLWCAVLLCSSGGTLLAPAVAAANTITVANTNDHGPGSLRQAIIDVTPGGTILVPAGTYTLTTAELALTKSVTISGAGASNTIVSSGGAWRVFHTSGATNTITISGLTISHGAPVPVGGIVDGGGVFNESAALTLSNDVIANNQADADGAGGSGAGGIADGGGVYSGGAVVIHNTLLSSNRASAVGAANKNGGITDGGGLFLDASGPGRVTDSTFTANVSDASAGTGGTIGGIADGGGAFMLTNAPAMSAANVTFTANTARTTNEGISTGGGLYFGSNSPNVTLTNATLSSNAVAGGDDDDGGNGYLGGANTQVKNTIVSAGAGAPGFENCAGDPTSLGHNLDSLNQCNFMASTDLVHTNPLLKPLQDNGGPVPTMALGSNSPAIDAGSNNGCPATDARGVLRPADAACDIGAYEVATPNATTGAASSVSLRSETLHGSAFNPDLTAGSAHFQYGQTTAYGSRTSAQPIAATTRNVGVSAQISGLKPHTTYHFRLVVTNTVGTSFGADRTFVTKQLPKISHLRVSPPALIPASRGKTVTAAVKTGATVSYTDTVAATTSFTIQRGKPGHRQGSACVKPSQHNRHAKRCTRWVKVGHFTRQDRAGANRFHFSGRIGGHKLSPGKYRLHAVPRDAAGTGAAANAGFRVKRS